MTEDRDIVRLLSAIKDLALLPYPFREGTQIDPTLILCLGQIGGLAMKAISEHKERQK